MSEVLESPEPGPLPRPRLWQQLLPWLITLACFYYLYTRIAGAAGEESAVRYLVGIFGRVQWGTWLALMIPYSVFFFLIDSTVVWRVVSWFNTQIRFRDILPIRASSYILSIVNEQVGKGAMGVYLNRSHGVPGWDVGSSMLFIMFCEFYYLLTWATVGYSLSRDSLPEVFGWIPTIFLAALAFFALFTLWMRGVIPLAAGLRERSIFHSFRQASPWQYGAIILLRSPALLVAVPVYSVAARLVGVEVDMALMLGYVPVVFFGAATPGPMRSVAIALWVTLFPEHPGEMTAFGFVQHNFFIFFNAIIGLIFLRRANRGLFGSPVREPATSADPP